MTSNFLRFVILIVLLELKTILAARTVESNELMNNAPSSMIMTHNFPTVMKSMQESSEDVGNQLCEIEYQVTRKRIGKCVKLSHGLNGCISGEYMNPFHPDCF
ncbi:uncharacterized protein LOC116425126 [Nomia melanderi]|uniref:uncharacterized protein LOC116425126 n=1 Tax=Nomia melanderi TaxID=2448451 RepID=UPI0013046ABD|nr:uncharacterized protein LOC116425126 [Nomia melanderi]XP_031828228.1 uncharacterized protein LOC116425126 [Nomia melanderi]